MEGVPVDRHRPLQKQEYYPLPHEEDVSHLSLIHTTIIRYLVTSQMLLPLNSPVFIVYGSTLRDTCR